MGIHGIFKEIGQGQRVSLAKLSADHYIAHNRPFRLAIDISIWLFQIQAGKGGSNPALRTFYYRLLRLLSLNIHPLFVFDGPNKPLFKRNKRVGGPGVRVASIPEFLAKQLLKQFGIPQHVAPGEAEAECALLQKEGIVDAVLSEDVDTLMFGSGVTLRNWTSENTSKSPSHVNVYHAEQTKEKSGLDREGMILVALMSGGDYITEGIPKCGPKSACDAARANFGRDLCALAKNDSHGLDAWKERLHHELRTNESKFFGRKNKSIIIPESFPDPEVLRYYTHPCVSSPEKLAKLRQELQWDQDIDFAALRVFTSDAFDWRCVSGAKKFIKNLAPAILVRELRLRSEATSHHSLNSQRDVERILIEQIHGKRNHCVTDGSLEYRVSFIPSQLVPIDLSMEEEDDAMQVGGADGDEASDAEHEVAPASGSQQANADGDLANSELEPRKRVFRPYYPDQPDKIWILCAFLQLGCPLLMEDFEAKLKENAGRQKKSSRPQGGRPPQNLDNRHQLSIVPYTKITKPSSALKLAGSNVATAKKTPTDCEGNPNHVSSNTTTFTLSSTQIPEYLFERPYNGQSKFDTQVQQHITTASRNSRPFAAFSNTQRQGGDVERTPRRKKRASSEIQSPSSQQKPITLFFSPSTGRYTDANATIIDLTSSPMSGRRKSKQIQTSESTVPDPLFAVEDLIFREPPDTVTKRRKAPLRRWRTEPLPVHGDEEEDPPELPSVLPPQSPPNMQAEIDNGRSEALDFPSSSPAPSHRSLPSPTSFMRRCLGDENAISYNTQDTDHESPRIENNDIQRALQSPFQNHVYEEPNGGRDQPHRNPHNHFSTTDPPSRPFGNARPSSPPDGNMLPVRCGISEISPNERLIEVAPPHAPPRKTHIHIRESLVGAWKECTIEADMIDMTGNRSEWKSTRGRVNITGEGNKRQRGWRKSAVEVLDLTGD